MAGTRITHLSRAKSAFIEFFFKPAILSFALFAVAWLRWASPPVSYNNVQICEASDAAAERVWKGNQFLRWKMGLFAYITAAFCEADNAYSIWFFAFADELHKMNGEAII